MLPRSGILTEHSNILKFHTQRASGIREETSRIVFRMSVSEKLTDIELATGSTAFSPASNDLSPDPRLCAGSLPGLTVEISRNGQPAVSGIVRAVTAHDLVLIMSMEDSFEPGDIVYFSLFEHGVLRAADQSGVIHWMTGVNGNSIVAMFTADSLQGALDHRVIDDRRGGIRFPVDMPVQVRSGRTMLQARILNYSLNGIGMVCRQPLELNQNYVVTGTSDDAEIRLNVDAQWLRKSANGYLIGCALEPRHGVLLAHRSAPEFGSPQQRLLAEIAKGLTNEDAMPAAESEDLPVLNVRSLGFDRLTLLRSCTPVLSAFLIGLSLQSAGVMRHITLLSGLTGVIASLVFSVLSRLRK